MTMNVRRDNKNLCEQSIFKSEDAKFKVCHLKVTLQ